MESKKFILLIAAFVLTGVSIALKIVYDRTRSVELVIATGGTQGEYYAMGETLAKVVPQYAPRLKVKVLETKGAEENMALVAQGKAHLALVQNDTPVKPSIRSIASMYVESFHLIVRPSSKIKEFSDIRSNRIATPPQGSGAYNGFQKLLRHYDIDVDQLRSMQLSGKEANQALIRGEVDGIFRIVGAGNRDVRLLLQQSKGKLVPINQADAIQIFYPETEPTLIPRGTYNAFPPVPPDDLPTVGVRSLLVTHEKLDEDVIKTLTTILYEYRNELVTNNPRASTIDFPGKGQSLGIPLHVGAKAYYDRNQPSFLQQNAEPIALLITLVTIIISFIAQIQSQIANKQKNRADLYNLELLQLIEEADRVTNLQDLESARRRLLNIFRQVIEDLDKDRLSPESYQLFVFPWEVAITTLRHRESLLLQASDRSLTT